MNNTENITDAFIAVVKKFDHYTVLNTEYRTKCDQAVSVTFEAITPLGVKMLETYNEFPESFPDAKKTFKKLLDGGHVKKIDEKVEKSAALIDAEMNLQGALKEYHTQCGNLVLPYQFKATKTRSSSGNAGEVGAGKIAQVLSDIKRIDPDAVVNFEGRRVMGTLKNGTIPFSYDVYGVSFMDSLEAKYNA